MGGAGGGVVSLSGRFGIVMRANALPRAASGGWDGVVSIRFFGSGRMGFILMDAGGASLEKWEWADARAASFLARRGHLPDSTPPFCHTE